MQILARACGHDHLQSFELRDLRIVSLEFVMEDDLAAKVILYQPGVVIEAPRMKDSG